VWPQGLAPPNHLILGMDDICEPMDGYITLSLLKSPQD
jgi:hypothetical protein